MTFPNGAQKSNWWDPRLTADESAWMDGFQAAERGEPEVPPEFPERAPDKYGRDLPDQRRQCWIFGHRTRRELNRVNAEEMRRIGAR